METSISHSQESPIATTHCFLLMQMHNSGLFTAVHSQEEFYLSCDTKVPKPILQLQICVEEELSCCCQKTHAPSFHHRRSLRLLNEDSLWFSLLL